jgi:hypothetical protein
MFRVVTDTENRAPVCSMTASMTLDFPTPDGPDMTRSLPRGRGSGEGVEEELPLPDAESSDLAVLRNAVLLHESLRLHLAHTGHGCEQRVDLGSRDDVVRFRTLEDLGEGEASRLE